jgi:YbbR domain-containing protein
VRLHVGTLLLSFAIASVLWIMAHGTSSIERGVDIPVVFSGIPDDLVVTDQTADVVNIRVLGSRAALRDIGPREQEYRIDVSGAKPGLLVHEVETALIDVPAGVRITSRSPAVIEVQFERRGRKAVRVRAALEGEPAEGFEITAVEVDPPRVWLTGARSDVLRLSEVATETIDVSGFTAPVEREVKLSLGSDHVWMEENEPVTVRLQLQAIAEDAAEAENPEARRGQ